MRVLASDIVTYYRPECGLKFFLQNQGVQPAEPSDYDQVLARLGMRHERNHLETLGQNVDLGGLWDDQLVAGTKAALQARAPVVYQGGFQADTVINGQSVTVFGRHDFLLRDGDGYVIRDSKLSCQIDDDHHIELIRQVQLYGWLYEKTVGQPPKRLEVFNGKGELSQIPYDGGTAALTDLTEIVRWKTITEPPYEPVGWTKCGSCGFGEYCLEQAEVTKDVALLPEVDQGLARALHSDGVRTYGDLLSGFNPTTLAEFKRPRGKGTQRVGKRAERILILAEALNTGKERLLAKPMIPDFPNYVMFDLVLDGKPRRSAENPTNHD